jgi:peptide/nickel transport system permease protein
MATLLTRYLLLTTAVVVLNFVLPRALPGDPLSGSAAGGLGGAAAPLSSQQRAQLRAQYHLDQPWPAQFAAYLSALARGDLGWSISRSAPVADLIGERLPWTLALVMSSLLVAAVGGGALGLMLAWRGGGRIDRLLVSVCAGLGAVPEFLVAMVLLLVFALGLGWFPLQGGQSAFAPVESWFDRAWHLTLPAFTLVLVQTSAFVLLARAAVRGVRADPYLAVARARGLSEWQVALRHAAPNALLPVLTLFGLRLGAVLGGAVVVERVFGIPGLGQFAFEAVQSRDYPVLQAIFLLASLGMVLANFGVELAYRRWEPRGALG